MVRSPFPGMDPYIVRDAYEHPTCNVWPISLRQPLPVLIAFLDFSKAKRRDNRCLGVFSWAYVF